MYREIHTVRLCYEIQDHPRTLEYYMRQYGTVSSLANKIPSFHPTPIDSVTLPLQFVSLHDENG